MPMGLESRHWLVAPVFLYGCQPSSILLVRGGHIPAALRRDADDEHAGVVLEVDGGVFGSRGCHNTAITRPRNTRQGLGLGRCRVLHSNRKVASALDAILGVNFDLARDRQLDFLGHILLRGAVVRTPSGV